MRQYMKLGTLEKARVYERVIKLHQENILTHREIGMELDLPTKTINYLIRKFAVSTISTASLMKAKKITTDESADLKALKAELLKTQEALRMERLRADAYDRMIDIAEANFKIPIRKKAGVKQ